MALSHTQCSVINANPATDHNELRHSVHRHALKDVKVARLVVGLGGDGARRIRIPMTRSASDPCSMRPLRVDAKDLGRICTGDGDKAARP